MATRYTVGYAKPQTLNQSAPVNPGYNASSGVQQPTQYYGTGQAPSGSIAGTWSTTPPAGQLSAYTSPSTTQNLGGTGGGGGGGSTYDPAAAQAAAQQAAAAAQARDSITGLAHSILDVYNGLYGNVNQAGADQAGQVNKKYDTENTGLTNEFEQQFPTIGNSYAARGAYDSSYRQDAEGNAQQSFQDQLGQQQQGRESDLAKIGQFVATNKAGLDANKQGINAILDHIGGTTDVNELTQIQSAIQQKLIDAQSQSAGLGTQGGYLGQIQAIAPTQDQTASLQTNLKSIIQGQANPFLKKSIGTKLIQTSGLPDAQKQQLINEFVGSIDQNQQQG